MTHGQFMPRPNCQQAYAISTYICPDAECGLHIVAWADATENRPICEIVIGREQLHGILGMIHENGLDL
jgi:hypothetical protein